MGGGVRRRASPYAIIPRMTLTPITTHTAYMPGANNLGIITTGDGGAIVIDTGLDREVGRRLRKALDASGLQLRAIINTHHHADHIGGNDYLLRNVPDVQVHAPPLEATFIAYPLLEPTYLNYGASPIKPLRTRWLMAKGTPVSHLIGTADAIIAGETFSYEVAGVSLEIIGLSGHSLAQIGVIYDGVCFAADGFFGHSIINKHGILYAHDIALQLATFERLMQRSDAYYLPGHGDLTPASEIAAVLHANRAATLHATDLVRAAVGEPGDTTAITARVLQAFEQQQAEDGAAPAATIPQYAIFASAVVAHLSYLEQQGAVQVVLRDRQLLWQRTE